MFQLPKIWVTSDKILNNHDRQRRVSKYFTLRNPISPLLSSNVLRNDNIWFRFKHFSSDRFTDGSKLNFCRPCVCAPPAKCIFTTSLPLRFFRLFFVSSSRRHTVALSPPYIDLVARIFVFPPVSHLSHSPSLSLTATSSMCFHSDNLSCNMKCVNKKIGTFSQMDCDSCGPTSIHKFIPCDLLCRG